jgi:hemerythrin-like domain-containing protein
MDRSTILRCEEAFGIDAPVRLDIYGAVHKGLRAFMFDTLVRVGAADAADSLQLADTIGRSRQLLELMRAHLTHEDTFVHPMIEAARPGAAGLTVEHHDEHRQAIAALEGELDALEAADAARRPPVLYRLYLRLARFVAENLEHMEIEETHNTAVLREAYDDGQIGAMIQRLLATIAPDKAATFHRWMFVGMSHDERVGMLSAMRELAPAPVFDGEVARARDVLAARDWGKLANALGVPAGAGLIEVW